MKKEYEITIVADFNDGDFITRILPVDSSTLGKIRPLVEAIKDFKSYTVRVGSLTWTHDSNYPNGEYAPRIDLGEKTIYELYPQFSKEIHDLFLEFCPDGECGFHSIESVEVAPLIEKDKWL